MAEETGERVALLHARHGYLRWTQGDNDGSLAAYERGLALLPKKPPSAARARILGSLAGALLGLGRYDEGRKAASDGVACAEAAGAKSEEARARNVLGSILVALGDVEEGIAQLEQSADLAAEAGPSDMRVIGPYNLAVNLAMAGRLREAQDAAARGVEAARTEGLQRRYGMDLAALEGDVLTRLGRWDEAAAVMDAGLALDPSGARHDLPRHGPRPAGCAARRRRDRSPMVRRRRRAGRGADRRGPGRISRSGAS